LSRDKGCTEGWACKTTTHTRYKTTTRIRYNSYNVTFSPHRLTGWMGEAMRVYLMDNWTIILMGSDYYINGH